MLYLLKRPAHALLTTAMLALLPVAGLTGCASGASDDDSNEVEVRHQVITADMIAGLKPGEQLSLDLSRKDLSYTFEFSKAPIDFSRITLINQPGDAQPMDKWLSATQQGGRNLLAAPDHTFRLVPAAEIMRDLSSAEFARFQSTGKIVKKIDRASVAPESRSALSETRSALDCYYSPVMVCEPIPPYANRYECHIEMWLDYCDPEP
jgi:hypothetical protein